MTRITLMKNAADRGGRAARPTLLLLTILGLAAATVFAPLTADAQQAANSVRTITSGTFTGGRGGDGGRGGPLSGTNGALGHNGLSLSGANVITGGTFTAGNGGNGGPNGPTNPWGFYKPGGNGGGGGSAVVALADSGVTVTGGTFIPGNGGSTPNGSGGSSGSGGTALVALTDSTISVTGGTFSLGQNGNGGAGCDLVANGGTITVYGSGFSAGPSLNGSGFFTGNIGGVSQTLSYIVSSIAGSAIFLSPVTPVVLVVTSSADDNGTLAPDDKGRIPTLRDAVTVADASPGAQILFDPTVFATPQTITLKNGPLPLSANIAIQGPTAGVTLDGSSQASIFTVTAATARLSHLTIRHGAANQGGGVNVLSGALVMTDCTLAQNTGAETGGGLFNAGTTTLTNCTIAGNSSGSRGGGVENEGGTLTLTNCTVTQNSVSGDSEGGDSEGGGLCVLGGSVTVQSCTFSGNAASTGSAIFVGVSQPSASVYLTDCICWGDTGQEITNETGSPTSAITASSCDIAESLSSANVTDGGGNLDADPLLTPSGLQSNGGPTQTLALLSNSPCIGAGALSIGPATDQRGVVRLSSPDIGAYQYAALITTAALSGTTGADGWYRSKVTVTLSATDVVSSVSGIYYTLDGGPQKTYGAPFSLSGDGIHTLTFWSTDQIGNTEAVNTRAVKIDTIAPQTSASVSENTVTLSASDTVSGVAGMLYSIDGGAQTPYSSPFIITDVGTHAVSYFGIDDTGNRETAHSLTVTVAAPTVSSLSPSSVMAGGPAFTLAVSGANFISGSVVKWNGTTQPTTFVSSTRLTATIPASLIKTAGTASITVTAPHIGTSAGVTFTVGPTLPPTITGLSPNSAVAGSPAFALTVTGANFTPASVVIWSGAALPTTFVSSTQLTATIPAVLITTVGTASITVTTPHVATSAGTAFTVNPTLPPTLTGISPASAMAGSLAFTLTVTGTNFALTSAVTWNGTALPTTFVSSTQLTATVPAALIATVGIASITVTTPQVGTSGAASFSINPTLPPTLTGISPSSAMAGGPAFTLTVTGANFVTGSIVEWNGTALSTTCVSSTQLTATVPAALIATAGAISITVLTPYVATSAGVTFIINGVPTLTGLSPSSAPAGGPAFPLTVTGTNFTSASYVTWKVIGPPIALPTTFVSSTQLTATVPAYLITTAGMTRITVTTPQVGTSGAAIFSINTAAVSLTATPSTVSSGGQTNCTLTLSGPVSSSFVGIAIPILLNGASIRTVIVPNGQTSATFSVKFGTVLTTTTETLSAAYGGSTVTAAVTVTP